MICSISGELAIEPVVSKVSGHIYESRLIKKVIIETSKDPITGQSLSEDDLIPIVVAKAAPPRGLSNASIPGLLSSLQSEWDDLMLESFQLKQSLDQTRQELAQALYQHDAACRVIARLMRERDEAYAQLQQVSVISKRPLETSDTQEPSEKMDVDDTPSVDNVNAAVLPDDILSEMNDKCKILSTARKGRKISPSLTTKESISQFTVTTTLTPYPKSSKVGSIGCIALSSDSMQERLLIGGNDKDVLLLDRGSGKVLQKLSSHTKKVNDVCFHPDPTQNICFTASADRSVKMWKSFDGKLEVASTLIHPNEISAISVHPTGNYLLSGGFDGSWKLWNLQTSNLVRSIAYNSSDSSLSTIRLHPDGLILATGTIDQDMKLWDLREQVSVATLEHAHAKVTSVSFNENGYLCATTAADNKLRIWDLRKLKTTKEIDVIGITQAFFDFSGTYLGYNRNDASSQAYDMHVCVVKEYDQDLFASTSVGHTKDISCFAWGYDASYLITGSADRCLKIHSTVQA